MACPVCGIDAAERLVCPRNERRRARPGADVIPLHRSVRDHRALAHRRRCRRHLHRPRAASMPTARCASARCRRLPADPSEGVLGAVEAAAGELDLLSSAELLGGCASSCTARRSPPTSSSSAGRPGRHADAPTAFATSLEIRRGIREKPWDHRAPFPPVAGAALPAPAGARPDRSPTARSSSRSARRTSTRPSDIFARRRRELGRRSACSTASSTIAHERAAAALAGAGMRRGMGLAVERGHADHGRVRAQLDRRGQRLHRARGHRLPTCAGSTAALASSACRTPCCCLQSNGGAVSVEARSRAVRCCWSVGPGRRRRRAQGLYAARSASGEPDLDGDRRHELRRHGDGERRGAESPTNSSIDGYHVATPSVDIHTRRRRRRHHRLASTSAGLLHRRPAGRRRAARARRLRAGRRAADRHRRAARARPACARARSPAARVTLDGALARAAVETQARAGRSASRSRPPRRA